MGGLGSGRRWHYGANETVDDYRELSIKSLNDSGLISLGNSFTLNWRCGEQKVGSIRILVEENRLRLSYRHQVTGGEWESINYPVHLSWSDCHFGGKRPWFLCPVKGCNKRVAKLYGGRVFVCRHCLNLAYPSQKENTDDRLLRQANKIRERLGWRPGILNPKGGKPKGMHWSTFEKLEAEHDDFLEKACMNLNKQLGAWF